MCAEHSEEEIVVDLGLATVRKRKTTTKHITDTEGALRAASRLCSIFIQFGYSQQ